MGTEISSLAIPMIESTSSNRNFEASFTKILREEFISFGGVSLVSRGKADAVLVGHVTRLTSEPLTFALNQRNVDGNEITYGITDARRLTIRLDIKMVERDSGNVIWHEAAMEERTSFEVAIDDPIATAYYQDQAVRRISEKLAKRIFLKTMERF
jgi:hypothetical protein